MLPARPRSRRRRCMTSIVFSFAALMSFLSLSWRLKLTWATGRPKRSFSSARVTRLSAQGRISPSRPNAGPVVVVHHFAAQSPAPGFLGGEHLLAEGDGQRTDGLDGEAAGEVILRIGLVELFGERVGRRRLVHADWLIEAAEHDVARLRHQVAAHRAAGVGEAVFEARDRRSSAAAAASRSQ